MKFKISKAYGRTRYYPMCSMSQIVCMVAGKMTLDEADISLIREQGEPVEIIAIPSLPE